VLVLMQEIGSRPLRLGRRPTGNNKSPDVSNQVMSEIAWGGYRKTHFSEIRKSEIASGCPGSTLLVRLYILHPPKFRLFYLPAHRLGRQLTVLTGLRGLPPCSTEWGADRHES
jgi:hypothetical protein